MQKIGITSKDLTSYVIQYFILYSIVKRIGCSLMKRYSARNASNIYCKLFKNSAFLDTELLLKDVLLSVSSIHGLSLANQFCYSLYKE